MMPQAPEQQSSKDPKDGQMMQMMDQMMQMMQQMKDMMATDEASQPQDQGGPAMPPSDFAKQLMQQG